MRVHYSPFSLTLMSCICCCALVQAWTSADDEGETSLTPYYYSVQPGSRRVMGGARHRVKKSTIRTTPYTKVEKEELLNKHNELRSQTTNAADMIRMEWDDDLEREAQRWADRCDFEHPDGSRAIGEFSDLGQNLYVSTHEPSGTSDPVQVWYDEISDYTYSKNNQCAPGKMCGHYTQVVWAKSRAVGCAIKYCDPLTSVSIFNKGYLIVCEYGPRGNYIGQFPYQTGGACSKCPEDFPQCVNNLCSKPQNPATTEDPNPGDRPTTEDPNKGDPDTTQDPNSGGSTDSIKDPDSEGHATSLHPSLFSLLTKAISLVFVVAYVTLNGRQ